MGATGEGQRRGDDGDGGEGGTQTGREAGMAGGAVELLWCGVVWWWSRSVDAGAGQTSVTSPDPSPDLPA